ncbi:hypothetical protein DV735_g98, partial [Chaetothyriales sp. CBS 134920]
MDKEDLISQTDQVPSSSGEEMNSRDAPIDLAHQFEISPQRASYLVAVHVLFMGFAPFLWNMLMPAYGRRPVLIGSMFLSCIAALGGGFARSYGTLMTARVFQSIGISSGFVVPGAVVVDLFSPSERGRKNGVWAQFVAIGSCLGGIIGGPVVYYLSWPWVMWIISIANGAQTVCYIFACPETSEPHRRQAQLGAYHFSELFRLPRMIKGKLGLKALVEPILLLQLPHETLIAFAYGVTFAVTSPGLSAILPLALQKFYSFDPVAQGLFFIGPLVGIILGELLVGPLSDWLMNREHRHAAAMHRPARLESRLIAALPGYVAAPAGVVIFGVTLQSRVHWIAPCIGFGVANFGLQVITTPLKTYCVDCTTSTAGSAMQLVNVVRQVISFTVPFWSPNLNNALGYGLGFDTPYKLVSWSLPPEAQEFVWGQSRRQDDACPNLIQIRGGTFYREHPAADGSDTVSNPPLFPNLSFELAATRIADAGKSIRTDGHWAVVAASGGSSLLEVLRGSHLCLPPTARTYPYLSWDEIAQRDHNLRIPSRAIHYAGFNDARGQNSGAGVRGAYLSARYESRREETDWSLLQFLKGETELNPWEESTRRDAEEEKVLQQVITDLKLEKLLDMPVSNLSNGQTRRSRIAKALLGKPELLLLDEPFMGLDPPTLVSLSPILKNIAYRSSPLLLLALRPQDPIPEWITHLAILGHNHTVALMGRKEEVLSKLRTWIQAWNSVSGGKKRIIDGHSLDQLTKLYGPPLLSVGDVLTERGVQTTSSGSTDRDDRDRVRRGQLGEPLIELESVIVRYGDRVVLGHPPPQPGHDKPGLNLSIHQGTRLALLGPNGSGKTTLLSLLTSDHPQSYSLPIKFFGRARLPSPGKPGLSLWDIQSRLGHSSPEIHAFFPKRLNIRQVLESAWAETYASRPTLSYERDEMVNAFLRWWEPELRQDRQDQSDHSQASPDVLRAGRSEGSKQPAMRELVEQSYPPLFVESTAGETDGFKLRYENSYDDLDWAEDASNHRFGVLPFGTQRLLLLLRAIIKQPDIIILDEAFSGLPAATRDKAMAWLEFGETRFGVGHASDPSASGTTVPNHRLDVLRLSQVLEIDLETLIRNRRRGGGYGDMRHMSKEELLDASRNAAQDSHFSELSDYRFKGVTDKQAVVVVSHVKEEIPAFIDEYVRLPGQDEVIESGRSVETGSCDAGSIQSQDGWNRVWGL